LKGRIDKDGHLRIERYNSTSDQYEFMKVLCPIIVSERMHGACCGMRCAHFGEPVLNNQIVSGDKGYYYQTELEITCGSSRVFVFDEFENRCRPNSEQKESKENEN
jgi:hypothetical protein